jgi:thioesterase domain-containing protein
VQPAQLELYLHRAIPLSKAMCMSVVSVQPEHVILRAPLAPNINQHETVFGGSASALAILAAWSFVHARLSAEEIANRLMIQRNTMEYEQPICGEFTATASLESPEQWQTFARMLIRKGKARIAVSSVLEHAGQVAGRLTGEFVAMSVEDN